MSKYNVRSGVYLHVERSKLYLCHRLTTSVSFGSITRKKEGNRFSRLHYILCCSFLFKHFFCLQLLFCSLL